MPNLPIPKKQDTIERLTAQVELDGDQALITALRGGEEAAFALLVDRHHGAMVRVATLFCRDRQVAEEVAQETWIAVLNGIGRFEGRSALKTWIFSILANKAKTRGQRESRMVAFSDLVSADEEASLEDAAVDPARFKADGWWRDQTHPTAWEITPEAAVQSAELRERIEAAIGNLPPNQRQVIIMRDLEGWDAEDVCNTLGLSETNQRVLLHRARSRVRSALEHYFDE